MGDRYKTKDMRFVAYLDYHGVTHTGMELDTETQDAIWVFETDDGISDLLMEFTSSEARVEPVEFLRRYFQARRAMNEFRDRTIVKGGARSY